MQQTDRELENVQLVPVLDLLCEEVVCKVDVEGKLMYSDDNHLSSYGASLLYSRIASALSLRP
jgi:lysophospholipase L1-like esterase